MRAVSAIAETRNNAGSSTTGHGLSAAVDVGDIGQLQAADDQHRHEQRQPQAQLVADHLGDRAHRGDEAVAVLAAPAREDHAVGRQARQPEENQQRHRQVRDIHAVANRNQREHRKRGGEAHHRRHQVDELVGSADQLARAP
jgi:hypothetical protein